MTNQREIRVGLIYRIVAGLFCAGIASTFFIDPEKAFAIWILDRFNLIGLIVVYPLFLHTAIRGKMLPDFLLKSVSEETYNDLTHTEVFFKEFNAKSVGFAVVALTMLAYIMYRNG